MRAISNFPKNFKKKLEKNSKKREKFSPIYHRDFENLKKRRFPPFGPAFSDRNLKSPPELGKFPEKKKKNSEKSRKNPSSSGPFQTRENFQTIPEKWEISLKNFLNSWDSLEFLRPPEGRSESQTKPVIRAEGAHPAAL